MLFADYRTPTGPNTHWWIWLHVGNIEVYVDNYEWCWVEYNPVFMQLALLHHYSSWFPWACSQVLSITRLITIEFLLCKLSVALFCLCTCSGALFYLSQMCWVSLPAGCCTELNFLNLMTIVCIVVPLNTAVSFQIYYDYLVYISGLQVAWHYFAVSDI